MPSILNHLRTELAKDHLKFDPWQIAAFYTALQVKGFVILSGISGTGKTKLAQGFARLLPAPLTPSSNETQDEARYDPDELIPLSEIPKSDNYISLEYAIKPYMLEYGQIVIKRDDAKKFSIPPLGSSWEIDLVFGDETERASIGYYQAGQKSTIVQLNSHKKAKEWLVDTFASETEKLIVITLALSEGRPVQIRLSTPAAVINSRTLAADGVSNTAATTATVLMPSNPKQIPSSYILTNSSAIVSVTSKMLETGFIPIPDAIGQLVVKIRQRRSPYVSVIDADGRLRGASIKEVAGDSDHFFLRVWKQSGGAGWLKRKVKVGDRLKITLMTDEDSRVLVDDSNSSWIKLNRVGTQAGHQPDIQPEAVKKNEFPTGGIVSYGPNLLGNRTYVSGGGRIFLDYKVVSQVLPESLYTSNNKTRKVVLDVNGREQEGTLSYLPSSARPSATLHLSGDNNDAEQLLKEISGSDKGLLVEPILLDGSIYKDAEGRPHFRLHHRDESRLNFPPPAITDEESNSANDIAAGINKGTVGSSEAQPITAQVGQESRQYLFLSVRPDWRDSKSLLGYYNPLTHSYEWTSFLCFVEASYNDYELNGKDARAWFIILDEMNLAHVEYYFADLLSVLESGRDDDGYTSEALLLGYPKGTVGAPPARLSIPPNLYIVGTVNMDETTYAFSPKVLDRAFTIEFTDVYFEDYPPLPGSGAGGGGSVEISSEELLQVFSKERKFISWAADWKDNGAMAKYVAAHNDLRGELIILNKLLAQHNMQFGYRVFDEIFAFLKLAEENHTFADIPDEQQPEVATTVVAESDTIPVDANAGTAVSTYNDDNEASNFTGANTPTTSSSNGAASAEATRSMIPTDQPASSPLLAAFDAALLMKVLPKFRGSRSHLQLPLCVLLLWATTPGDTKLAAKAKELNEQLNTARDSEFEQKLLLPFRYRALGERVQRMLRELRSDGFASFG